MPCVNQRAGESIVKLPDPATMEQEMALPPDAVRALSFWKLRPGAALTLIDGEGRAVRARLLDRDRVLPFEPLACGNPHAPSVALYQALPEKERFELVLQKAVELGVGRVVPFVSQRSTTLEDRDSRQRKSHRWPEIILRAAKQCRRPDIPELAPVMPFAAMLEEARRTEVSVMLYEGKAPVPLRNAITRTNLRSVALIVGPEGGFSAGEVCQAQSAGVLPVTLGQRILRTETAAIAGTAIIQFALGGLG